MSAQLATRCLLVLALVASLSTVSLAATPEEALATTSEIVFIETPLGDAMAFMAKQLDVKINLADGVDKKAPLSLKAGGKIKDLLTIALKPHGLTYKVEKDAIVIVKLKKATPEEALETNIRRRFDDTPLLEAMEHLIDDHAVDFAIGDGVNEKVLLNFEGDIKLKDALTKMLKPHGLTYEIEDGAIAIVKDEKLVLVPTEVAFIETPLVAAMKFIADQHRVKTSIAAGVDRNLPISLMATNCTLRDVLKKMLKPHGLTYKVEKDTIVIVKSEKK